MSESFWYCQKCGNKNDGLACGSCGGQKLTGTTAYGVKFHIYALLDFGLVFAILLALVDIVPTFGDVLKSSGSGLPWLTGVICSFGNFLQPYGRALIIAIGCLAGLFFFTPKIKKHVELKYLIILFLLLVVILLVFVIAMFSPMFYLGEPAK